jgi:hypothetical protein
MEFTRIQFIVQVAAVIVAAIVSLVSFAFLIPLDSVQAVTGVSIIVAMAYVVSFLLWALVLKSYKDVSADPLTWLNTHMVFLVLLPTVIGATAMNVTSVQNTRNLLAGQIAA